MTHNYNSNKFDSSIEENKGNFNSKGLTRSSINNANNNPVLGNKLVYTSNNMQHQHTNLLNAGSIINSLTNQPNSVRNSNSKINGNKLGYLAVYQNFPNNNANNKSNNFVNENINNNSLNNNYNNLNNNQILQNSINKQSSINGLNKGISNTNNNALATNLSKNPSQKIVGNTKDINNPFNSKSLKK